MHSFAFHFHFWMDGAAILGGFGVFIRSNLLGVVVFSRFEDYSCIMMCIFVEQNKLYMVFV